MLSWRLGIPAVERLRHFLGLARGLLSPGATVGFVSPDEQRGDSFFRRLWAAYLAPDLNFLNAADAPAYTHYMIAYGVRIDRPGVSLAWSLPGGGLYRIGPP